MYCRNCGNEISNSSSFCVHCGKKIKIINQVNPSQPSVNQNINQVSHLEPEANYIQPVYSNKPKKGRNGLPSIFLSLMAISVVLMIASIALLLLNMDKRQDIDAVFKEGPTINREVFDDWDKEEYSITTITNEVLE